MIWPRSLAAWALLAAPATAANFTIANGQIFTPGFVVLDAPQPGTPLGGGKSRLCIHLASQTLHVAIDVTANGQLPLSPLAQDSPSQIFNVTMFLSSYDTGRNFTVSNGTAGTNGASLGEIMAQEAGSTVKHVNWVWPDCLTGDGEPDGGDSDRGAYNISIRQNYRLNGENHYTIFDVPIAVTNSIDSSDDRPPCDVLTNNLLSPAVIDAASANAVGVLFAPGDATDVEVEQEDDNDGEGLGGQRPEADPDDGLGSGAVAWGRRPGLQLASALFALAALGLS